MVEELIIALGDQQIPYNDVRNDNMMFKFIKEQEPDTLILGGDVADMESVSSFMKSTDQEGALVKELVKVREYLTTIRNIVPKANIHYIKSNHEERLEKYLLKNARALSGLTELKLESLLHCDELNIKMTKEPWLFYKGTLYSHLDKFSVNAGASAKSIGIENLCDVIHFHTHRCAHIVKNGYNFIESGCQCLLQQPYQKKPTDSANGFVVIRRTNNNTKHYQLVHIKNHQFYYGNKLYKG